MAQNPLIKRYLDVGMAFTQMTQARAEAIVRDLVQAGEVQTGRAEDLVGELLDRSRRNTEALLELVRKEVRDQLVTLGLIGEEEASTPAPTPTSAQDAPVTAGQGTNPPAPQSPQAPAAAKKVAKKAKATAKKSTKKSAAKKASASKKSSAAKKSAGKKAAGKKAAGKKAAKKATTRAPGEGSGS